MVSAVSVVRAVSMVRMRDWTQRRDIDQCQTPPLTQPVLLGKLERVVDVLAYRPDDLSGEVEESEVGRGRAGGHDAATWGGEAAARR